MVDSEKISVLMDKVEQLMEENRIIRASNEQMKNEISEMALEKMATVTNFPKLFIIKQASLFTITI